MSTYKLEDESIPLSRDGVPLPNLGQYRLCPSGDTPGISLNL